MIIKKNYIIGMTITSIVLSITLLFLGNSIIEEILIGCIITCNIGIFETYISYLTEFKPSLKKFIKETDLLIKEIKKYRNYNLKKYIKDYNKNINSLSIIKNKLREINNWTKNTPIIDIETNYKIFKYKKIITSFYNELDEPLYYLYNKNTNFDQKKILMYDILYKIKCFSNEKHFNKYQKITTKISRNYGIKISNENENKNKNKKYNHLNNILNNIKEKYDIK